MDAKKIIFLDRDGVINEESIHYIKNPEEYILIEGSIEAIAMLSKAGFTIFIATNQAGIGRGIFSLENLKAIHAKLNNLVERAGGHIEKIYFCPHHPDDACDCRKPKPGLLQQAASEYHFPLNSIPFVCDAYRDVEAARAVDATPILVKTGYGMETLKKHHEALKNVPVFDCLMAYVKTIIPSS